MQGNEPRWSVVEAAWKTWRCPATAARCTQHLRLRDAWVVHAVATLMTGVVVLGLVAIDDLPSVARFSVLGVLDNFVNKLGRFFLLVVEDPWIAIGATAGIVLGIEVGFAVLAGGLMSWGARDEPLRSTWYHALRRTWLHTTTIPIALFVVGTFGTVSDHAERYRNYEAQQIITQPASPNFANYSSASTRADALAAYNAVVEDYRAAVRRRNAAYMRLRASWPWYIHCWEEITIAAGFAAGGWLLWALLRGIGAEGTTAPVARPPTCESCGYNLTAMAMDARCPECGEPVADSLGPHVRDGPAWRHRRDIGGVAGWWRSCVGVVRAPKPFGRTLCLDPCACDHRWSVALHLPFAFVIGTGALFAVLVTLLLGGGRNPLHTNLSEVILMSLVLGCLTVAGTVVLTCFAASGVGVAFRVWEKRNVMVGSMRVACYMTGFLAFGLVVAVVTGVGAIALGTSRTYTQLVRQVGLPPDAVSFFAWLLANLIWAVWYFSLIVHGTAGTRYANSAHHHRDASVDCV